MRYGSHCHTANWVIINITTCSLRSNWSYRILIFDSDSCPRRIHNLHRKVFTLCDIISFSKFNSRCITRNNSCCISTCRCTRRCRICCIKIVLFSRLSIKVDCVMNRNIVLCHCRTFYIKLHARKNHLSIRWCSTCENLLYSSTCSNGTYISGRKNSRIDSRCREYSRECKE